jgi:catechol 2,3-dioxygenase-like lactoylglutathione lyase family enzyme
MHFASLDHVGVTIADLQRSIRWWSGFLGDQPFHRLTMRAGASDDYAGRIMGYPKAEFSVAFWSLPGGTVLALMEYHHPKPGVVDMETFNAGNTHLCLETRDIDADCDRMSGVGDFRSPVPIEIVAGPFKGARVCYIRDPDGVTIELVEFPAGRPFEVNSPFVRPYETLRER